MLRKSSVVKYSLSVTVLMLLLTLIVLPSGFRVFSQNPFTETPAFMPLPAMIESDDTLVERTGNWASQSTAGASGGIYLYSSGSTDDVLSLHFEGSYISVGYVQSPVLGTLAIEVDNTVLRTVITTNVSTIYGTQAIVSYLSPGSHTLRVYPQQGVIALDNFYTSDPNTTTTTPLPSVPATLPPTVTPDTSTWAMYDDRDSGISYAHGDWEASADSSAYQTTLTSSSDFAASLTFYFEGTGVEIVYIGETTGGGFRFEVDSVYYQVRDSQTSGTNYANSIVFTDLPDGLHRAQLVKSDGIFMFDAVHIQGSLVNPFESLAPSTYSQSLFQGQVSTAAITCTYTPLNGNALAFILDILFETPSFTSVSICLNPAYAYVLDTGIERQVPDPAVNPNAHWLTQTALAPIMDDVTIVGNGATIQGMVNGGEPFGIFAVGYTGHLALDNVTVTGGYLVGQWYSQSDNSGGYGAGIYVVDGQLTLNNVILRNNSAAYGGGGIALDYGSASITNSQIINNTGNLYGGGGIYKIGNGVLTINNSVISNNTANHGGAISLNYSSGTSINNTRIANNIANGSNSADNGGGIYLEGATLYGQTNNVLTGNQSLHSGSAIGIYSAASTTGMSLTGSCIFGNGGVSISNPLPVAFDATNNWWGSPDGPSIGGGSGGDGGAQSIAYPAQDSISGNINYANWQGTAPGICPQQTASTPIATAPPTNTPYPTDTPMPTPTPCYATVRGPNAVAFRDTQDLDDKFRIFRVNTLMTVVDWKPESLIPDGSIISIEAIKYWKPATELDPSDLDNPDTVTWLSVQARTTDGLSQPGFMALRSAKHGELLNLSCNENTLPGYQELPTTPTPGPSPTANPLDWYVVCTPRAGDNPNELIYVNVRATPALDGTLVSTLTSGAQVRRTNTAEIPITTIRGGIEVVFNYVEIEWPQGSATRAWVARNDEKGALLEPQRQPSCPVATPTPMPTSTPVPLVCPAGVSTYTPGRFSLDRQAQTPLIYTNLFDLSPDEQIAHVGSYRFHSGDQVNEDGATLDIMPASLEECSDSQNCTPSPTEVPVYLPVRASFVPLGESDSMLFLIDNVDSGHADQITWEPRGCEPRQESLIVGRREIYFRHIDPDDAFLAAHTVAGGQMIPAGTLIGYVQVPDGYIENPSNSQDAFHLAFQLRFYSYTYKHIQACHDEVLGVLTASGRQVVDDWQFGGTAWNPAAPIYPLSPTHILACQAQ